MDNINNNLQTNNMTYNDNVNASVSNNVMMNNTIQNSNSFNTNVSPNINNNVVNNQLINNELNNNIINSNISNNMNNDFKTLEGATNLFKSVNFVGNSNCIFIAYNADYAPNPNSALRLSGLSVGSKVGGIGGAAVGSAVGGFLSSSINNALEEYIKKIENPSIKLLMNVSDFCGYLVNITEFGIGFIPLMNNYSSITSIKNVEVHPEFFVSISNSDVFNISLKKVKLPFMCARVFMKITFNSGDLTPKPKMSLRIHSKLTDINYQTNSVSNLLSMYKK